MRDLKAVAHVSTGSGPRSTRLRRRAGLVSALSAVVSLGLVASASAKVATLTAACGQTISSPGQYSLGSNIGPCSSTAITIRASNVTLDLKGHTVAGMPIVTDSSGNVTGGYGEGPGIQVVGVSNDVVKNGTVRDFDAGVLLVQSNDQPPVPATNDTVTGLNVINNVGLQPPTNFSDGIALIGANHNTVSNNTVTGNGSRGVGLIDSSNYNTVSGNTVTATQGIGVRLTIFDTHNMISGNTITGNASSGVSFMFSDTENVVANNTIDSNGGNGVGASFLSSSNVVKNNSITNSALNGISFGAGNETATGNLVSGNGTAREVHGGAADGIFVSGGSTTLNAGTNDVVSNNTVMNNAGNGIEITCTSNAGACADFAQKDKILNNVVHGNGGSLAGTQVLSGGFLVGVYDLLDGNNSINNAATSPAGNSTPCDSNTWLGNYTGTQTAYPSCTQG